MWDVVYHCSLLLECCEPSPVGQLPSYSETYSLWVYYASLYWLGIAVGCSKNSIP